MPFDGSGNFNRVMDWTNDAAANIKIRADRHDQNDDDIASGLSNTITKDGQSQPTANIPMNGKKLINLGAPTNPTDAASKTYVDTADALAMPKAGGTFTGKVTLFTSTTGAASANIPAGVAPSAPVDGDIWQSATFQLKARLSGVTYTLGLLEKAQTWTADQTFSTNIFVTGIGSLFGAANATGQVALQGNSVEVGINRNADGAAFYDLHGTTGTDFDARLIRNSGVNGSLQLVNNGTGGIAISSGGGTFTYGGSPILVGNLDNLALAAGFGEATVTSDGTKSSGTYTPTNAGNNMRSAVNGGAFNLAADANNTTAYTVLLVITNNASAGAITTAGQGWTKVDGDPFTTTNGATFLCMIAKIGSIKALTVTQVV